MASWRRGTTSPMMVLIAAGATALVLSAAGCSEEQAGGGAGGAGGGPGDGGSGGVGPGSPSGSVGGTTTGGIDTVPIEPSEVVERFAGDFVATTGGDEGVQLRGCAVDAPELGEHVLYVARGALDEGEADREMVLVLEPFSEIHIEHEVRGSFFLPPEGGPWTCDEIAAVLAAEPPEARDCAMTFLHLQGEEAIEGYRFAASAPYDSCFAEPGALTWVTWELLADAITWGEQDYGDAGYEGEPTEVVFERVGEGD